MPTTNEQLVLDFCLAWSNRDADELLEFFAPDAVYHNIPMAPVTGHDQIRQIFSLFLPPSEKIEFEVLHIAAAGHVVLTERVDRFTMSGKEIALPVAGVFEIADGKITAWRDYFDMAAWTNQTS